MDPRAPTPFQPRPFQPREDTGGASADYVRAQTIRTTPQADDAHLVAPEDGPEDRDEDHGPALIALVIIVLVISFGLLALVILGATK